MAGSDDVEALLQQMEQRAGNLPGAWRQLYDRKGRGVVGKQRFVTVSVESGYLSGGEAERVFEALACGPLPGRLSLAELCPDVGLALRELSANARAWRGGPVAFFFHNSDMRYLGNSHPGLRYPEFMRICLSSGVRCGNYQQLYHCIDVQDRGHILPEDLDFMDWWETEDLEQMALPCVVDLLAEALDRREPLDTICEYVQQGGPAAVAAAEWPGLLGLALLHAAQRGTGAHVEILLRHGANISVRDHQFVTPLHAAAARGGTGPFDTTRLVAQLAAARGDVCAQDVEGATPLHRACAVGRPEVVATLCHLGANLHAIDSLQGSCLMVTVNRDDSHCCKVLLAAMADPCRLDRADSTPLLHAIEHKRMNIVCLMQEHVRANYVTLLPSALDVLHAEATRADAEDAALLAAEAQKIVVNYMLLAEVPVDYLAQTVNHWRSTVPEERCVWPAAEAVSLERWPT